MNGLDGIPKNLAMEFAFVGVDMAHHSTLVERYKEKFQPVRDAFRAYVTERVGDSAGAILVWEGDGGIAVFWGGDDFVDRAVWAALGVIADIYLFNLRHNPFSEHVECKAGVHRGVCRARDDPGNWYGEGLNTAGKFFKEALAEGRVVITDPVFMSLDAKIRARFHRLSAFQGTATYDFGRDMLDPSLEVLARFIESKRVVDIRNEAGDTLTQQEITFANASQGPLEFLTWNLGHDETPMAWRDCKVRAWETGTGRNLEVQPIDVEDPLLKVWRFRFPPVGVGQQYSLTYEAYWNGMFPVTPEPSQWAAKIPAPIERLEVRILCPPGFRAVAKDLRLQRYVDPADKTELLQGKAIVEPRVSRSGRWEILLELTRPRPYHVHLLSWSVEKE